MTGYTPDYLGQLIRKGKLTGKQIYLNIAWVTTEEAVRDYLESSKTAAGGKSGVGKLFLARGLKGRVRRWFIKHSSGEEVIRIARRVIYILIAVMILFCLFLIYALVANVFHI